MSTNVVAVAVTAKRLSLPSRGRVPAAEARAERDDCVRTSLDMPLQYGPYQIGGVKRLMIWKRGAISRVHVPLIKRIPIAAIAAPLAPANQW